jgi:hypothetical protein
MMFRCLPLGRSRSANPGAVYLVCLWGVWVVWARPTLYTSISRWRAFALALCSPPPRWQGFLFLFA